MIFAEEFEEVFERGKGGYLAHCISADFAMEKEAMAKGFGEMGVDELLKKNFSEVEEPGCLQTTAGKAADDYKGVFHLVTKKTADEKATYENVEAALIELRTQIEEKRAQGEQVTICMPFIGSGADGLEWNEMREVITDVMLETHVVLVACEKDRRFF